MFKFLVMSFSLLTLPACQHTIPKPENHTVGIRKHSESRVNLANELTPFTASRFTEVQAVSTRGYQLNVSHYTLPSHLWSGSPVTPAMTAGAVSDTDTVYSLPGELALQLNWNGASISAGRQALDTPFLQTDDALLVPNLFTSAMATFEIGDNVAVSAYYIDKVSEWRFGADHAEFSALGNSLGTQSTGGAAALMTQFTHDRLNGQVWFYHLPDIENIAYFEMHHFGELMDGVSYELSGQIDWARATGAALLGDIGSTTLGVNAGVSWADYSVFVAFNQLLAGSSTAIGIGGDPYFTSLEYRSFADVGSTNGYAIAGGINYQPAAIPLNFELVLGQFKAAEQNNFEGREIDISVGYDFAKDINLRLFFSSLSGQDQAFNEQRFTLRLNIPF